MRLLNTDPNAQDYRVFLDGVELFDCLEVDEEACAVVRRRPLPFRTGYIQRGVVKLVPKKALATA